MQTPIKLKDEWLDRAKLFPVPDWEQVEAWVRESFPASDYSRAYSALGRDWVDRIVTQFPSSALVAESRHFILALPAVIGTASAHLVQLEQYREQIARSLWFLNLTPWPSKVIVLIFPDPDTFTSYLSDYYDDGAFMIPGGVCLNRGYAHFALADSNLAESGPVLAHELAHVFLAGFGMPLWLEEAVVQTIEHRVTARNPYVLDHDMVRRHQAYWTSDLVQDFWAGRSFHFPNEGSELSYHLARFLLEAAAGAGPGELQRFLKTAKSADAGFSALVETLGIGPDAFLSDFLGPSDWSYRQNDSSGSTR